MIIKNEEELQGIMNAGRVVALARDEMAKAVKPGITTKELDVICGRILAEHGAVSAPKSEYNFPGESCISINEVCAHGIPGDYVIQEHDYVNIDVSASLNGYFADTGVTVICGTPDLIQEDMLRVSKEALYDAINAAVPGKSTATIGKAIFKRALTNGYTVLRNLTGHGIGRSLHEDPHYIFNYGERHGSTLIKEGQVLALETFISDGDEWVEDPDEGEWELITENRSQVVQFEHTIIAMKKGNIIATASEYFS